MDNIQKKNQLSFIYDLFKDTRPGDLNYIYRGVFTHNLTDNVLALAEVSMEKTEEQSRIKRRVYLIMVEGLQNVAKHQDKINTEEDKSSFFAIQKHGNEFYITTANLVANEKTGTLKANIEKINKLGKDELKDYYKVVLTEVGFSEKGGAGLGLIDMARKSGNKLYYDFTKFNDEFSYFFLYSKIPTLAEKIDEPEKDKQNLKNVINLHKILTDFHISIIFNSIFDQESLLSILSIIEGQMSRKPLSRRIYHIVVEMLQNIIHHGEYDASDIEGRPGIFFISENTNEYLINTGNYIYNEQLKNFKEKIEYVNQLESIELESFYDDRLLDFRIDSRKETGLGLIDIRLKSRNTLKYEVHKIDNHYSFLMLQTRVLKS